MTTQSKKTSILDKNIDRRTFLKTSALAGVTGFMASVPGSDILAANASNKKKKEKFPNFTFNKDDKFKILQLTDTHYIAGDPRSERALKNVIEMLDTEKPDLVIHTGDVIFGKPVEASLREILMPISQRHIPFAVTLGNHDEEFGVSRQEVYDIIKTIPYNINTSVPDIFGVSNDIITLSSTANGLPKWVFYLFDSNHGSTIPGIKGYGHIHFDQIAWHRKHSEEFAKSNGNMPVPSLAFFHIPIPEYNYAIHIDRRRVMKGNFGEEPCPPNINSGLFTSMKEMGDVQAIICGHDHDNDYAMHWNNMFLMFGRFSGCDTVYNNLKPNGARVIEITGSEVGFCSWIRMYGGEITQKLKYPEDFKTTL